MMETMYIALSTTYLHQSGLLVVEYGHEGDVKQGEIYLLAGQPTYAQVGSMSGQEALLQMLSWSSVRLTFRTDAPRPPANLSPQFFFHLTTSLDAGGVPAVSPVSIDQEMPREEDRGVVRQDGSEQYALSCSLTRIQRRIYCLVDGQRTVADLARCIGKQSDEVERVLLELRSIGLIL